MDFRILVALAAKLAGNVRIVLVAAFVAIHASLLIGTQIKRDPANSPTLLGTLLRYYEALTGADNTFSFFAPHVAGQSFSQVIATGPDGRSHITTYDRARTEGDIRVEAAPGTRPSGRGPRDHRCRHFVLVHHRCDRSSLGRKR